MTEILKASNYKAEVTHFERFNDTALWHCNNCHAKLSFIDFPLGNYDITHISDICHTKIT